MSWAEDNGYDAYDGEDFEPSYSESDKQLLKKFNENKDFTINFKFYDCVATFKLSEIVRLAFLLSKQFEEE